MDQNSPEQDNAPNTIQSEALAEKKELLKAAAAEVVSAAAPFGDDVSSFATKWTAKLVDSGSAADAAGEFSELPQDLNLRPLALLEPRAASPAC